MTRLTSAGMAFVLFALPVMAQAQNPAQNPAQTQTPATTAATATPPVTPAARIAELEAALKRQTQIATNAQAQVEGLRADLALKDELIALAVTRNAELYTVAAEIADKGLSKRSLEPFVQGKRVEMENLKQSYEDRLRAARFYDSTLPPSVQAQMDAALAQKAAQPPAQP